jgi:butyrate kinase
MRILTINPGSTSTKVAVFEKQKRIAKATIRHYGSEMIKYETLADQLPIRQKLIVEFLHEYDIELSSIDGFIGRGGLVRPLQSGLYRVNKSLEETLKNNEFGHHASNLGGLIAKSLARQMNKEAYIADPVVVDELEAVARFSGLNGVKRKSIFHALNQKAVARRYSEEIGVEYDKLHLIVAHLGGGISVGYHKNGRVVDVNNALDGDGPMSPERSGSLPVSGIIDLIHDGTDNESMKRMVSSYGGMFSYLNTKDCEEVSDMIAQGNNEAKRVMDAMVYQIAKEIGALYATTKGDLDAILLTGGLAYNQDVIQPLIEMIDHISDIHLYPGENELEALAYNMHAFLQGTIDAKEY